MIIGDGPNMNACSYCNVPQLDHYRRYGKLIGWHTWQEPDNALRKERWRNWMNIREAVRRQKLIVNTLAGLREILTTNLHQQMDPLEEEELTELLDLWREKREA